MPPFWSILRWTTDGTHSVSKWLWHVVTHFRTRCPALLRQAASRMDSSDCIVGSSSFHHLKSLPRPLGHRPAAIWRCAGARRPCSDCLTCGHSSGLAILKWCVHVDVAYTPSSAGLFYCLSCHVIALGSQEGLEWDNDVRKGLASLAARQAQN